MRMLINRLTFAQMLFLVLSFASTELLIKYEMKHIYMHIFALFHLEKIKTKALNSILFAFFIFWFALLINSHFKYFSSINFFIVVVAFFCVLYTTFFSVCSNRPLFSQCQVWPCCSYV